MYACMRVVYVGARGRFRITWRRVHAAGGPQRDAPTTPQAEAYLRSPSCLVSSSDQCACGGGVGRGCGGLPRLRSSLGGVQEARCEWGGGNLSIKKWKYYIM